MDVLRPEHRVGVPGSSFGDEGSDELISLPANIAVELLVLAFELVVCGNIAVELLVLAFELVVCGAIKTNRKRYSIACCSFRHRFHYFWFLSFVFVWFVGTLYDVWKPCVI